MGNAPIRRAPTPSERSTVETLQTLISTPYSEDQHLDLLKQLWHAAGLQSDFHRISYEWKRLGFQREDPISDIRGGGVLALQNLVRFLEDDSAALEMLEARRRREKEGENYPWAAAGINLTRKLCEVLEVIKPSGQRSEACRLGEERPFWHLVKSTDSFQLLYAWAFKLLDEIWAREGATYMDFPRIIQMTTARVQHVVTNEHSELPGLLREEPADELAGTTQPGDDDRAAGQGDGGGDDKKDEAVAQRPAVEAWGAGGGGRGRGKEQQQQQEGEDRVAKPEGWGGGLDLLGWLSRPTAEEGGANVQCCEEVIRDRDDGGARVGGGQLCHRKRASGSKG